MFKVNGKYYLFNITWPKGGMRTVVIHRADKITGPWEGRLAFQDKGVAQGGMVDTPDGKWFAYLFRDYGSVGRIPYLVPVKWEDGWPVIGVDGKVPDNLDLPASKGLIPGIVASDEFSPQKRRTCSSAWSGNGIIIPIIIFGQLQHERDFSVLQPDVLTQFLYQQEIL